MEKSKRFRVIYEVMAVTPDGELVARYFAANRKTAEKIKKDRLSHCEYVTIAPLMKRDHCWVNPTDVERL